jgi:hypothetical protein
MVRMAWVSCPRELSFNREPRIFETGLVGTEVRKWGRYWASTGEPHQDVLARGAREVVVAVRHQPLGSHSRERPR